MRYTYPSRAHVCSCQSWRQTEKSTLDIVSKLAWHTFGTFVVIKSTSCPLRNTARRFPFVHLVAAAVQMFASVPLQSQKSWNTFSFPCGQNCVSTAGTNHWLRSCLAPDGEKRITAVLHFNDCQTHFCCFFEWGAKTHLWTCLDHLHDLRSPHAGLCHRSWSARPSSFLPNAGDKKILPSFRILMWIMNLNPYHKKSQWSPIFKA